MVKKRVRIDVTSQQLGRLRQEVLCNQQMSAEQRRKALRRTLPIPADGGRVDLYCDGTYLGAV
ncbi:MAG: hypothetical protein EPO21_16640 [Chloroflexota bacterium]|nr:MAG: hypothetical protein EPO21_16640 [Chloroflexota bacterium]